MDPGRSLETAVPGLVLRELVASDAAPVLVRRVGWDSCGCREGTMKVGGLDVSEFVRLERSLQGYATRLDSARMLLAESFVEFGASGRVYTKAAVLEAFTAAAADNQVELPEMLDFDANLLAPGTVLVTYRSVSTPPASPRSSRRSSIWQQRGGSWQMLFHQATPIPLAG